MTHFSWFASMIGLAWQFPIGVIRVSRPTRTDDAPSHLLNDPQRTALELKTWLALKQRFCGVEVHLTGRLACFHGANHFLLATISWSYSP
jgi:hypothetical protein